MNQTQPSYTRDQLIAFLAAWMKTNPELTLSAARIEGMVRGYTVGRREYEEARRIGTGSPIHPEHASTEAAAATWAPTPAATPSSAPTMSAPAPAPAPSPSPSPSERAEAAPTSVAATPLAATPVAPSPVAATGDRAWFVSFLKQRPTATFAEVNAAAASAGVRPTTPIGFGLARKAAGIASVTKPKLPRPSVPEVVVPTSEAEPEVVAAPRRRSAPASTAANRADADARADAGVFADVARLMADYERMRAALLEVARIVRDAEAD